MKRSKFLKLVKADIVARYERNPSCTQFVCVAISRTLKSNPGAISQSRHDELLQWIEHLLDRHYILDSWVIEHLNMKLDDVEDYKPRMQATRLAWVDWMIAAFEAEGK